MQWTDDGIVLSTRKHGETSMIVSILTRDHGRHIGLVRGGSGKRARGIYQPGNAVSSHWKARLPEHLGAYECELTKANAADLLNDPLRLAALSAACAVADAALPEREPHAPVFEGMAILLDSIHAGSSWPSVFVKWELGLLRELGFGLDLSRCAATGRSEELAYVSPKSGRAVSIAAAEPYLDVLLPLPGFLLTEGAAGNGEEVQQGLRLSGYFLSRHVFAHHGNKSPQARERMVERLRKSLEMSAKE